tara:strand:- start:2535 stop:2744 length:210 start_codon:yes stop_codon:yes gene_type:complete
MRNANELKKAVVRLCEKLARKMRQLLSLSNPQQKRGKQMPRVGNKHYSYTKAGMKAAAKARKKRKGKRK